MMRYEATDHLNNLGIEAPTPEQIDLFIQIVTRGEGYEEGYDAGYSLGYGEGYDDGQMAVSEG